MLVQPDTVQLPEALVSVSHTGESLKCLLCMHLQPLDASSRVYLAVGVNTAAQAALAQHVVVPERRTGLPRVPVPQELTRQRHLHAMPEQAHVHPAASACLEAGRHHDDEHGTFPINPAKASLPTSTELCSATDCCNGVYRQFQKKGTAPMTRVAPRAVHTRSRWQAHARRQRMHAHAASGTHCGQNDRSDGESSCARAPCR